MNKQSYITVAFVGFVHTLVSFVMAIDKGSWFWYGSLLGALALTVYTVQESARLDDAETKQRLADSRRSYRI